MNIYDEKDENENIDSLVDDGIPDACSMGADTSDQRSKKTG